VVNQPEINPRTPGETIKPNYGQIEGKWHLLKDDGTSERELTEIEVSEAIGAGLIIVTADDAFKAPKVEDAAPVEVAPVAVKPPRKEGKHCAICIHYAVPKGKNPLNCDEGNCAKTNTPVTADGECASFWMNEGLRD
jgi:hypothetical protein